MKVLIVGTGMIGMHFASCLGESGNEELVAGRKNS